MICEHCNIEMNKKSFVSQTVHYCSNCQEYKITEIDCDHEFQLVLLSIKI
jgi:hypothetical protein